MSRNLGDSVGRQSERALRVERSGWRDPRLWIGVLLIASSVVVGARLFTAADDAVALWAVDGSFAAGSALSKDDVVARNVRFADAADEDLYLSAAEPLPDGMVLSRSVGPGELVARAALEPADASERVQVPLEVDPNRVPGAVTTGSVVDVYVIDRGEASRSNRQAAEIGPALAEVTVVAAPEFEETFAVSGFRQIVVAVDAAAAPEFEALLGSLADPVVRVLLRR